MSNIDQQTNLGFHIKKNKAQSRTVKWKDMFLREEIMNALNDCNFENPSEVQCRAIPDALAGKDIICQAKSGRGKTAVFVISVLESLHKEKDNSTELLPFQCLVIAHTRELALQIHEQFKRMSRHFQQPQVRFVLCIGGVSIEENVRMIKNQNSLPHVLIGTPGRVLDLILRKQIYTKNIKFLIIDQCDRALETESMQLEVLGIYDKLPKEKQIMMFSATISSAFTESWKKLTKNPSYIVIGEETQIPDKLMQFYLKIKSDDKEEKLINLLDDLAFNQVIIFVNKVERAIRLTTILKNNLFDPICIHSSLRQQQRTVRYREFKANKKRVLVATDLIGRGIDIEKVDLVINYDFPFKRQEYLHRVGRAGRFGARGMAINFVRPLPEDFDELALRQVSKTYKFEIKQFPRSINYQSL